MRHTRIMRIIGVIVLVLPWGLQAHGGAAPRPDLALTAVGSTITVAEDAAGIDGLAALCDGRLEGGPVLSTPVCLVLTLPAGKVTTVDAVSICFVEGGDEAVIAIESGLHHGAMQPLRDVRIKEQIPRTYAIECSPVAVARLRITMKGPAELVPEEIIVFEEPLDDPTRSILSRCGANIAASACGGGVFSAGTARTAELSRALDLDVEMAAGISGEMGVAVPVILSFKGNEEALVRSIGFRCPVREGIPLMEDLPAALRVFASREDPFAGYESLGEFTLSSPDGQYVFDLQRQVRARFLKLEIVLSAPYACLGELAVYEGTAGDYTSVLLRGENALLRRSPLANEGPPAYVLFGYDSSGSSPATRDAVAASFGACAEALGGSGRIACATSSAVTPFTDNAEARDQGRATLRDDHESFCWYRTLAKALRHVKTAVPSGATAVVVFAATEESEGSIEEVWEELKTSPARLYTIDTGGMETIASTGAGRDLFNMAWFGRGKHFAPATAAELAAACTALAGDCLAAPRFCTDCGARLVPGAKFCTKCGTKVRGL